MFASPGTRSGRGLAGPLAGRLLNVRYLTTVGAGTYLPTPGTNSVLIELVGGGGGGGGCPASTSGQASLGPGGQGGGFLSVRLSSGFAGANYSVGAAGAGGASGANTGTAGGNSTFTTTSGTTYTAAGGSVSGAGVGPFGMPWSFILGAFAATTGGDYSMDGGVPPPALALSANNVSTGPGGSSAFSAGARSGQAGFNTATNGANAGGRGGGGAGGASDGTAGAAAGGNGSAGMIIIYEYA